MQYLPQIMMILFFLSEALAQIPQVKANSVFQLCFNIIVSLKDKIK